MRSRLIQKCNRSYLMYWFYEIQRTATESGLIFYTTTPYNWQHLLMNDHFPSFIMWVSCPVYLQCCILWQTVPPATERSSWLKKLPWWERFFDCGLSSFSLQLPGHWLCFLRPEILCSLVFRRSISALPCCRRTWKNKQINHQSHINVFRFVVNALKMEENCTRISGTGNQMSALFLQWQPWWWRSRL